MSRDGYLKIPQIRELEVKLLKYLSEETVVSTDMKNFVEDLFTSADKSAHLHLMEVSKMVERAENQNEKLVEAVTKLEKEKQELLLTVAKLASILNVER